MAAVLSYLAAVITGLWGIAHAVPTRQVVAGFRDTSTDNRRIMLQEWLAEAITMWTLAALVTTVTAVAGGTAAVAWRGACQVRPGICLSGSSAPNFGSVLLRRLLP